MSSKQQQKLFGTRGRFNRFSDKFQSISLTNFQCVISNRLMRAMALLLKKRHLSMGSDKGNNIKTEYIYERGTEILKLCTRGTHLGINYMRRVYGKHLFWKRILFDSIAAWKSKVAKCKHKTMTIIMAVKMMPQEKEMASQEKKWKTSTHTK